MEVGHVVDDRFVQVQLAFVGQLHHGHGGEGHGRLAPLEDRLVGHRRSAVEAGRAVALGIGDLAVLDHGDGQAGNVRARQGFLDHGVDLGDNIDIQLRRLGFKVSTHRGHKVPYQGIELVRIKHVREVVAVREDHFFCIRQTFDQPVHLDLLVLSRRVANDQ